jgi:hypothetical protein
MATELRATPDTAPRAGSTSFTAGSTVRVDGGFLS